MKTVGQDLIMHGGGHQQFSYCVTNEAMLG